MAKAPSRIGTAPFRPLQAMNARSARDSDEPVRVSATASGRATTASTSASTAPCSHVWAGRWVMSIVRPSAMKTTISASPASEPWKRSISVL